jgi:catechol 2,3-dioxygenase-like lactoylglutathione lyase family enzyme
MFEKSPVFSSFSVDDLDRARSFYVDTLGLRTSEPMDLLQLDLAGGVRVMIYPKPDHTPAAFTVLNFVVDDIEKAVDDLAARGVGMTRHEGLEQDERGINRDPRGPAAIAWFTDPAGNVLSVVQER